MAAAFGYGDAPPLFQIYNNILFVKSILKVTEKYAVEYGAEAYNCINLVLVFLGLVKDSESYLKTCTERGIITKWQDETYNIIQKAMRQGGVIMEDWSDHRSYKMFPISILLTFRSRLAFIGQLLNPGYATIIGIIWKNGTSHGVILRKDIFTGNIEYIDPQIKDNDGTYPFIRKIPDDLRPIINEENAASVFYFRGPTVAAPLFGQSKFQLELTGPRGFYMNVRNAHGNAAAAAAAAGAGPAAAGPGAAGAAPVAGAGWTIKGKKNLTNILRYKAYAMRNVGDGHAGGRQRTRKQKHRKRRSGKSLKSVRRK